MTDVRYFGCNLCEALCGLKVTLDGNRIVEIRGDAEDVFSKGHICPKGPAMRELYEDPDRLRTPMRRTSKGFEPITWDQAFELAGDRLRSIRERFGRDAIAFYIGNPSVHSHRSSLGTQVLSLALRTHNFYNANSQDSNPRLFACMQVYGDSLSVPVPDIDRTDFLLMLGANPLASNGSMWTLGDPRKRLASVRQRGGRVVLIDPRRNETAALCDEHHFIQPGSDALFLLAMLQVLFSEKLVNEAAVDSVARGRDQLEWIAAKFTPERVESAVGISAEVIRRLARELAKTRRAAVYGRLGICQNEFGPLASWLVEAINVVSGHFDCEGGVMFPTPAADLAPITRWLFPKKHGRWHSRVRGLPEFLDALPSAVMAEEMETPGEGQIRALITFAGNPVLSTPNGTRLAKAIEQLEFSIAVDIYMNETSRRADLVLPPTHIFESGNFDLIFPGFAVRNVVHYNPPILKPAPGAKDDWEILSELAMQLLPGGKRAKVFGRRITAKLPEQIVDMLLRLGRQRLTLEEVTRHPHGLDLGPLQPARKQKVRTPDGRAQLAPGPLVADVPRLERWLSERSRNADGLVLIGRRHLRSNNSWMHNLHSLVKGPSRSHLMMHPQDAAARGIVDKTRVQVRSRVGMLEVAVHLTDEVRRGVVSLPHGFGHTDPSTQRLAGSLEGPNANAISDEQQVEPVLGTSILNGIPVEVSPA
jgi:anaerobic selenocysteine-containing dehydrogenase